MNEEQMDREAQEYMDNMSMDSKRRMALTTLKKLSGETLNVLVNFRCVKDYVQRFINSGGDVYKDAEFRINLEVLCSRVLDLSKELNLYSQESNSEVEEEFLSLPAAKTVESSISTINKEEETTVEAVTEESVVEIQAKVQTVSEVIQDASISASINKGEDISNVHTNTTTKENTIMAIKSPDQCNNLITGVAPARDSQATISEPQVNTVNTNTTKGQTTMKPLSQYEDAVASKPVSVSNPKIVKAELVVNITLSANNVLSAGTLAKAQAKKGVIINTRSAGTLRYNSQDSSIYSDFIPLSETTTDKYGNYNCAIWRLTDEVGNVTLLNHEESVNYWSAIFNQDDLRADELNYYVKVNFPAVYNYESVNSMLVNGQVRSYVITFNDLSNMFTFRKDEYRENLCLIPANSTVDFSSTVAELDKETIGTGSIRLADVKTSTAVRKTQFKEFLKSATKSTVRREARKEATAVSYDTVSATPATSVEEVTVQPTVQVQAAKEGLVDVRVQPVVAPVVEVPAALVMEVVVEETPVVLTETRAERKVRKAAEKAAADKQAAEAQVATFDFTSPARKGQSSTTASLLREEYSVDEQHDIMDEMDSAYMGGDFDNYDE